MKSLRKILINLFIFINVFLIFEIQVYSYESVCWNCYSKISSSFCEQCSECRWYRCKNCDACKSPEYGTCNRYIAILNEREEEINFKSYIIMFIMFILPFIVSIIIKLIEIKNNKEARIIKKELKERNLPYYDNTIINKKIKDISDKLEEKNSKYNSLDSLEENERRLQNIVEEIEDKERIKRMQSGIFKEGDILYDNENNKVVIKNIDGDRILIYRYETQIIEWKMSGKKEEKIKIIQQYYNIKEIKDKFRIKDK